MDISLLIQVADSVHMDTVLERSLGADRDALLIVFEQAIQRMNHLEQLILAFATLGLTGWGFLHVSPFRLSFRDGSDPETGKIVFAFLFSAIVSGAFSVMFLGRMANNIRVLDVEALLLLPVNTFANYGKYAGPHAKTSLVVTAMFIPIIATSSILYTAYCIPWMSLLNRATKQKIKACLLSLTMLSCLIIICYTAAISIRSINRWEEWCNGKGKYTIYDLVDKSESSTE